MTRKPGDLLVTACPSPVREDADDRGAPRVTALCERHVEEDHENFET